MSKKFKMIMGFLAVIVLLAIVMTIPPVADKVGAVAGVATSKVVTIARTVAGIGVGLMMVSFGVAALASTVFIGAALIVIGLALVVAGAWPLFKRPEPVE